MAVDPLSTAHRTGVELVEVDDKGQRSGNPFTEPARSRGRPPQHQRRFGGRCGVLPREALRCSIPSGERSARPGYWLATGGSSAIAVAARRRLFRDGESGAGTRRLPPSVALLLIGAERLMRIDTPTRGRRFELDDWSRAVAERPTAAEQVLAEHGKRIADAVFREPAEPYRPVHDTDCSTCDHVGAKAASESPSSARTYEAVRLELREEVVEERQLDLQGVPAPAFPRVGALGVEAEERGRDPVGGGESPPDGVEHADEGGGVGTGDERPPGR